MDARHKEMVAEIKPGMDIKATACQEMEACQEEKEPTSVDRKTEAAQKEDVPIEYATVIPVKRTKKETAL
jgi:hypothetical protein